MYKLPFGHWRIGNDQSANSISKWSYDASENASHEKVMLLKFLFFNLSEIYVYTITFKLRLVYLTKAESFPMLLSQIGCGKRLQPIKIFKKYLQYLKCLQEIISGKKNPFLLPNGKTWKKKSFFKVSRLINEFVYLICH